MSDSSDNGGKSTVNQQILDAVSGVAQTLEFGAEPTADGTMLQMLAVAAGMAMQDAVAQQRQAYLLQNAATTALVNALLSASADRAEQINQTLSEIRETYDPDRLIKTLNQLSELVGKASRRPEVVEAGKGS